MWANMKVHWPPRIIHEPYIFPPILWGHCVVFDTIIKDLPPELCAGRVSEAGPVG